MAVLARWLRSCGVTPKSPTVSRTRVDREVRLANSRHSSSLISPQFHVSEQAGPSSGTFAALVINLILVITMSLTWAFIRSLLSAS